MLNQCLRLIWCLIHEFFSRTITTSEHHHNGMDGWWHSFQPFCHMEFFNDFDNTSPKPSNHPSIRRPIIKTTLLPTTLSHTILAGQFSTGRQNSDSATTGDEGGSWSSSKMLSSLLFSHVRITAINEIKANNNNSPLYRSNNLPDQAPSQLCSRLKNLIFFSSQKPWYAASNSSSSSSSLTTSLLPWSSYMVLVLSSPPMVCLSATYIGAMLEVVVVVVAMLELLLTDLYALELSDVHILWVKVSQSNWLSAHPQAWYVDAWKWELKL